MLILCSSCNSKYLINSADLKPKGRKVECAKCGHNWFQTLENDFQEDVLPSSVPKTEIKKSFENQSNEIKNLPATYVESPKPKLINSILTILFFLFVIMILWKINSEGINFLVLVKYYINEFYFNLNLLIKDLAKVIYQILN